LLQLKISHDPLVTNPITKEAKERRNPTHQYREFAGYEGPVKKKLNDQEN
jgi:hypothetical protein